MARLSLVEALTRVQSLQQFRGHGARALSRAKREALAPKPPSAAQLRYLRAMRAYAAAVEQRVSAILLPVISDTQVVIADGVRQDAEKDLDDAFARLNEELLGLADALEPTILRVGRDVTAHANREVGRMLNIDLRGGEARLEGFVSDFVAQNVKLVRSVSFDQLERLREIVNRHQAGGDAVRPLREELMDAFGLTRQRASLIARDQTLKAAAQVNQLRQQQVGVRQYVWSSSRDTRVRDEHAELDGQLIDWSVPPVVDERTGRRAHAGQDFQCRCTAVASVGALLGRE